MLELYIALCLIWGVFFTGYMFRNWYKLPSIERDRYFWMAGIILFLISTVLAPLSIWNNLPYVIAEIKGE